MPRRVLLPPQPYFRAELGGVVNIECLIEFSREIGDRGELDAEAVRDRRFCFAKRELNADFRLRRRSTVFPKRTRRMRNGVFVECDRHRDEAGLWILGGVFRKGARGHEPFRFERENTISGGNPHARRRVGRSVRGAGDPPEKL